MSATSGHGPNIGNGYVKYIIIDSQGNERPPVVFPATIARAQRKVEGGLRAAQTVDVGGQAYWVGEDAALSSAALTLLSQERLYDAAFIPALLKSARARFGHLNGAAAGHCVSGLPASWALDQAKAAALGERLRATGSEWSGLRIIAEPLGLVYGELLDNHGQMKGDSALQQGRIGVVDLGHLTIDLAVVQRLQPVPESLETFQLGSAGPLRQIRAQLSGAFGVELSMHQVDQVVRGEQITIAGAAQDLPLHWDRPLLDNAQAVAARIVESWGNGAQLDTILIGGGGAEQRRLVAAIQARFRHARTVARPQLAIARGYARLARRFALGPQGRAA